MAGGKPGKAGKEIRPREQPAPAGQQIGGNAVPMQIIGLVPDPIAGNWLGRLFAATTLVSPAASGRFRPGDKGALQNRDTRDIGPLQDFRGKALIGRGGIGGDRLGMQGGPGSQPAFPGTGDNTPPSIRSALAGMDLPNILRT